MIEALRRPVGLGLKTKKEMTDDLLPAVFIDRDRLIRRR
jgi:hypothetical protein